MTTTSPIPRPLRGSRIDVFYPVKEENVPSLSSLDSAFQLQEYISLVIRLDVHDVDRIVSIPAKTEEADSKVTVDESCWIYEQLRYLVIFFIRNAHLKKFSDDWLRTLRTLS